MKTTKRVLSMIVVLGLIASMFTGITVSAADPIEYDFMNNYRTEGAQVDLLENYDGFAKVLKVNSNYGSTYIASEIFEKAFTNTTVVFSFKYKSEVVNCDSYEHIIAMTVRDGRTGADAAISNTTNKPGFAIKDNGDFTYATYNYDYAETPADFVDYGEYEKWYQIDSVYDLVNKTVTHYVDGKYLGTSTGETNPTSLNYMVLVSDQGQNHGSAYFADIKIKEVGETVTMTLDQENTTATDIAVKFSEPLSSVADLKLYDVETQAPVAATPTKINEFTYSFSKAGLKAGAEYKVAIPAGVSGLYGSATTASEIYFNAADSSVLVDTLQGTPGGEIFNETFDRFSNSGQYGTSESYGTQNLGSADVDGNIKWEARIVEDNPWPGWGFNTYARSNILRIDAWQGSRAGSVTAKSAIGQTVTGQDVEIYFDAEVQIPTENSAYFEFNAYDPAGNRYPVFQINKTVLSMCTGLASSSTVAATTFANPNVLTSNQETTLANAKSYKVLLGLASGAVKVYVKVGDAYTEIGSTTMNATLAANGFANIGFRMKKEIAGDSIATYTATYIDNVSVVKCAGAAPANFSDTFNRFSNMGMGSGESSGSANIGVNADVDGNLKWEKFGYMSASQWGFNTYARSNALRIDAWQRGQRDQTGVKTKLDSAFDIGEATATFDAEVAIPNAGTAYFEFVAFDKLGNMYPVFQINESVLSMCAGLVGIEETTGLAAANVVPTSFANPNQLTANTTDAFEHAVSYKVVLNMAAATAKVYAKVGGVYTEVGSTTVNPALIANGFDEIGFRMQKVDSATAATYTSTYINNVEVFLKAAKSAPVVKSVRFDSAPASDEVPFNTSVVKVFFNKDMDSTTLGGIEIDGFAAYTAEYDSAEKAYVMTLTGNLAKDTDYVITVPATVKDADQVELARAYAGAFHTTAGVFEVTSFTVKNQYDEDATFLNTFEGDTLTAEVVINNEAGNEGTYYLIYAVYDGNKLVAVNYVPVNFDDTSATASEDISFDIPATEGELGVKVMLWESFSTLTPVVDAFVLE